jgi:hypothetical protein
MLKYKEYKNILIIKISSLGDVLHTLPFVAVLQERFAEVADMLAGKGYYDSFFGGAMDEEMVLDACEKWIG